MTKDVELGLASSLTMILLVGSVVLLLRSFYKRLSRMQNREDDGKS
jgi:hypothetical protein